MPLLDRHATRPIISVVILGIFLSLVTVALAWKTNWLDTEVSRFFRMMSLGTALSLCLLVTSLLIKCFSSHPISRWLCLLVILIGCLRFLEIFNSSDFLDRIIVWLWGISLNHPDGLMSQLTSICLILMGIALCVSADVTTREADGRHLLALALVFCVVFLVIVAIFGYLLQLKTAFTWMGMRMAPHTAVVILLMSAAIYGLNLYWGIQKLFQMKILNRFLLAVMLTLVLGLIVFVIVQQQIHYAESVNSEILLQLSSSTTMARESLETLTRTEHEIKEVILLLTMGFVLVCLILFSGIFFTLNFQLHGLRNLLLVSTGQNLPANAEIPYIRDKYEFGVIARSIESFMKLNQSQRRLQSRLERIIESMPNGIIIVNRDGRIELVNQAICKMFHYQSSELISQPLEILLPESFSVKHPQYREAYFNDPQARPMGLGRELFGITKEGNSIALEIGLAPIESDQGIQVLASVVDISERKLAEANLAASREKIDVTSKSLEIGIWEYLPAENKLVWDETMFALYGVDPANFKGVYEEWRSRLHPDDIAEQEMKFLYAIKTETEFTAKFRIINDKQEVKYIQAKARVERNSHNQSTRIIGTNFDVTREEMVLRRIQQLDNLRVAIVEQSDDAIISKTPEGIITSWNKGAEKMFGYLAYEAIGRNIKQLLIFPEKYQEHDELMARILTGEYISHHPTQLLSKNGQTKEVSINFSPIRDDKGNIISISSIKRDITESIKAAQVLLEHQKELERSNKSLETFAYVASHDLKAPLRGINQLASWLEEDIRDQNFSALSTTTDKIKIRIKRMEALLDDLLAYYRVEKMQGFYKDLDVAKSAQDLFVMNNTRPGIQLVLASDLPCFTTYITPFEQVITNLFTNAIKHHDRAEGTIWISSKSLNADWFEFCVKDDGPGIEPQFHQRIFNMFQTLKPRDEVEGSGMGLALVKKIVEQYGGQVRVESQSRGAAFYFTWPATIKREIN